MRVGLACGGIFVVVSLAIAACSDGEELGVSEPVGEASKVADAIMEGPADVHPEGIATPVTTEEPPPVATPTVAPGTEYAEWLAERDRRIASYTHPPNSREPAPAPRPDTLPWVEFPDDIALLTEHYRVQPKDGPVADDVERIYWSNGELVRETIILAFAPVSDGGYNLHLAFHPDGSSIIMTVCVEGYCKNHHGLYDDAPPGHTALYESQDGGITWEKLATFDLPWVATRFLPAKDGETHLLLQAYRGFFQDIVGHYTKRPDKMVWSSSSGVGELPDLDLDEEMEGEECRWCLPLPDGRLLLSESYDAKELIGPRGAAEGRVVHYDAGLPWPTIRDPEMGEQWPIWMPPNVLRAEEALWPLAIQQGPFLRVPDDLDGCLPVLAEPSPDAEELACMAARVLLTDLGEAEEIEGTTWHRVRTPAGIEGWAEGGSLE